MDTIFPKFKFFKVDKSLNGFFMPLSSDCPTKNIPIFEIDGIDGNMSRLYDGYGKTIYLSLYKFFLKNCYNM